MKNSTQGTERESGTTEEARAIAWTKTVVWLSAPYISQRVAGTYCAAALRLTPRSCALRGWVQQCSARENTWLRA